MGDILCNVHTSSRWVVALCDSEIYGRKLEDGAFSLDLTGKFFDGKKMNAEEVREEIERCIAEDATFNIVGTRSVAIAKESGLINNEGIRIIDGVPIALVLL